MLEKKNYELSIWMVQEIFIIFKLCHLIEWKEGLESHFLLMTLMNDKNLLHIINKG
jgi:hypothetical protein